MPNWQIVASQPHCEHDERRGIFTIPGEEPLLVGMPEHKGNDCALADGHSGDCRCASHAPVVIVDVQIYRAHLPCPRARVRELRRCLLADLNARANVGPSLENAATGPYPLVQSGGQLIPLKAAPEQMGPPPVCLVPVPLLQAPPVAQAVPKVHVPKPPPPQFYRDDHGDTGGPGAA